ncbi:unnamed protein product [Ilex paraguariensis]|uniref:Uncharacterized protein n=1 Tax=Ilex paraguariensis TaxID=185542 RepID=A0ABC8RRD0_9AQUA
MENSHQSSTSASLLNKPGSSALNLNSSIDLFGDENLHSMPHMFIMNPQTSLNFQIPSNSQNPSNMRIFSKTQIPSSAKSVQLPGVQSSVPESNGFQTSLNCQFPSSSQVPSIDRTFSIP